MTALEGCGVPACTRIAIWDGVCDHHHMEAEAAYPVGILREVGCDLRIDLALDARPEPAPGVKLKIHAVPLVWQGHGGTPYGRAVLARQVERVGLCEPGNRNQILNRTAYVIGGYVAGGEIEPDRAAEALLRAAEIARLPLREASSTIRSAMRKGMARPITAPR